MALLGRQPFPVRSKRAYKGILGLFTEYIVFIIKKVQDGLQNFGVCCLSVSLAGNL